MWHYCIEQCDIYTEKNIVKKQLEIAQLFYYQYVYMCFMKKF